MINFLVVLIDFFSFINVWGNRDLEKLKIYLGKKLENRILILGFFMLIVLFFLLYYVIFDLWFVFKVIGIVKKMNLLFVYGFIGG